jgi:alkylation response protein AidB-like acyl-CoA dehydrogenase
MQLGLTEDQALFHETTVRFIEHELPLGATRALHDDPNGFDREWFARSAELGWFAMLVPDEHGGGSVSGSAVADAAIIAEEMGRNVQPGPFIPMQVVASAVARHGSEALQKDLLPALAAGTTTAAWAVFDNRGGWDDGRGVRAVQTPGGYVLRGSRGFVQDAASADVLLIAAECDGEPAQFVVPTDSAGLTVRPLATLDLSRRIAHVDFDGVTSAPSARLAGGTDLLRAELHLALALLCADTVGAMDRMFAMTVEYAKDRIAFGRPIGSFQALKHIMADQTVYLETAQAAAAAAVEALERNDDTAAEMVHMAASYIGDVGNDMAQECLQIHGGIGYTWEHDLHLLLRRVRSNSALYGEPTWHRDRVCAFHRLGVAK